MKQWIERKIADCGGKQPRDMKSKPAFDPDSASDIKRTVAHYSDKQNSPSTAGERSPVSDAKPVPANGPDTVEGSSSADDAKPAPARHSDEPNGPATAEGNSSASDAKLVSDKQNGPDTAEGNFPTSNDAKPASSHHSGERNGQNKQNGDDGPKDLWQIAYEALSDDDRQSLLAVHQSIRTDDHGGHTKTLEIIDEVIRLTKEQYENYQKGGMKIKRGEKDIDLRQIAHKILDATLSFKHIIGAIVAFNPAGHAASAWTIVSLGLTMTQNHMKIRDALFESSEFLADVLARCAFIEKEHYYNDPEPKDEIKKAILRVYVDVLHYTAQVQKSHSTNVGRKIVESVSTVTEHPIIQIRSSIEASEKVLDHWVKNEEYLKQREQAEEILDDIDKMLISLRDLHRKFDLNNLRNAEGASFDSYMNQHESECLEGTRVNLIQEIRKWGSSAQGRCIYWLNGKAGTGKSTISRTVAKVFNKEQQLGASFFFKRGEGDRGNATRFFPTIARQLIGTIPELEYGVSKAIDDDPDISMKTFRDQFNKLLLQPLCSLNLDQRKRTLVIVVDALDECDGENDIKTILKLLPQVQQSESVHLKIFLTSRPELWILLGFKQIAEHDHLDFMLHNIDENTIKHDISLFLTTRFSEIRKEYSLRNRELPLNWPEDGDTRKLTDIATPLFILAATFSRFIGQGNPRKRLKSILDDPAATSASGLGATYLPVLNQIFNNDDYQQQNFQKIAGSIILLASPLSVNALASFLDLDRDDIYDILDLLHSVLHVPSDSNTPVRLLHLSFRDFLLDPTSKSKYSVNEKEKHQELTIKCLAVMRRGLKRNICDLESEGMERRVLDPDFINHVVSPELQYSCRYWVQHLDRSNWKNSAAGMDDVFMFLKMHLLYWAEAMSIMGFAFELVGVIEKLERMAEGMSELSEFLFDARRFFLKNRYIADVAPLQLYCSGLVFAPTRSITRNNFKKELPSWICMFPKVEEFWSAELETFEGHARDVWSVAFSPDGQLIASASWDQTIQLRNSITGAMQQIFGGHSQCVLSVAFSLDGRLLASGSRDSTVRLWDIERGATQQVLEGHSDYVQSVAFSPDGRLLASGSSDYTVRLWDIEKGATQQVLGGHSGYVQSVAFSPDGKLLAMISVGNTVALWNMTNGALQTLRGHSGRVLSVAFSPDGRLLASGSQDNTVKLWDTAARVLQKTLYHPDFVEAVVFSPDGQRIASGSSFTVKLWDIKAGHLEQKLDRHLDPVLDVKFLPDGKLAASCSYDETVKLWDTSTGNLKNTLEDQLGGIFRMVISPDGKLLVTPHEDSTLRIRDLATGILQQAFKDEGIWDGEIIFSPDSKMIAFGPDNRVKLWDITTGALKKNFADQLAMCWPVAFSSDSELLVSGSKNNGTVQIWNIATGALQQTFQGHSNKLNSVAFSSDSQLVASNCFDHEDIKIWCTKTGACKNILKGNSNAEDSRLLFSPDDRLLVSYTHEEIMIWDTATGILKQTSVSSRRIKALEFSREGLHLETNLGVFDIKSCYVNVSNFFRANAKIELDDHWVAVQGRKVLWLPPEYRPRVSECKDGVFVLGHKSGHFYFMKFCI